MLSLLGSFVLILLRKKGLETRKNQNLEGSQDGVLKMQTFLVSSYFYTGTRPPEMLGFHSEGNFLSQVGRERFLVKCKQTSKAAHSTIF